MTKNVIQFATMIKKIPMVDATVVDTKGQKIGKEIFPNVSNF